MQSPSRDSWQSAVGGVLLTVLAAPSAGATPVQDLESLELTLSSGAQLRYYERLPSGVRDDEALPLFLCLPPGDGGEAMVQAAQRHLGDLAWKHGFMVLYPVARGGSFTGDAADEIHELVEHVLERREVDRERVVLAGISNGGRAVFDVASRYPDPFTALVAVPGARYEGLDLEEIRDLPVWMRVGALDSPAWREQVRETADLLRAQNCNVDYAELADQGHVLTLPEAELFDWLEHTFASRPRHVTFTAADGLTIDADLYDVDDPSAATILLCHQASSSRGEYRGIGPRLAAAGYRAVAIDQRSGRGMNSVKNTTAERARGQGKSTEYVDARADITAVLDALREERPGSPLVLWGSSYSAALALVIEAERDDVDAVLAFSPGEYFGSELAVAETARAGTAPVLVVSPEGERARTEALLAALGERQTWLVGPQILHGSKTLFMAEDAAPVWERVLAFLRAHVGR